MSVRACVCVMIIRAVSNVQCSLCEPAQADHSSNHMRLAAHGDARRAPRRRAWETVSPKVHQCVLHPLLNVCQEGYLTKHAAAALQERGAASAGLLRRHEKTRVLMTSARGPQRRALGGVPSGGTGWAAVQPTLEEHNMS